jgi:hypothetical protein
VQAILAPFIASWVAMWLAGLFVAHALSIKEALRARLASMGAVWTRHETVANRMAEVGAAQAAIDAMSDEQVERVAQQMMQASHRPACCLLHPAEQLHGRHDARLHACLQ